MKSGLTAWHNLCPSCGYESSELIPSINSQSTHTLIDEVARVAALESLRRKNFSRLLKEITKIVPSGLLLDVGSAHGWFADMASIKYQVIGIEPDYAVFEKTRSTGIPIRFGCFPNVLERDEKFDVIVFNDVIEHIPNVTTAIAECRDRLNNNGCLVLNLPDSHGFIYRIVKLIVRIGYIVPFERMWQKGLPSPHIHYFNQDNLLLLMEKHGFERVHLGYLPSINLKGLKYRLVYVGKPSSLLLVLQFLTLAMLLPWLRFSHSDIMYSIYKLR